MGERRHLDGKKPSINKRCHDRGSWGTKRGHNNKIQANLGYERCHRGPDRNRRKAFAGEKRVYDQVNADGRHSREEKDEQRPSRLIRIAVQGYHESLTGEQEQQGGWQ